jgi:hypothetical protein
LVEEEFKQVVGRELEELVKKDLKEVIDAEFERIAGIYRETNKLCLVIDVVRVHPHVEIHDLSRVEDGLPSAKSVYFIFDGGRVIKIDAWSYEVAVVGDKHDHVIGVIDVVVFGDRCFINKDVDEYELEYAVKEIVADLLKGLEEGGA